MSRAPSPHQRFGNGDEGGKAASHLEDTTPGLLRAAGSMHAPMEQAHARPRHPMEQSHPDTPSSSRGGSLKKAVPHPTAKREQLPRKWQVKLFFPDVYNSADLW